MKNFLLIVFLIHSCSFLSAENEVKEESAKEEKKDKNNEANIKVNVKMFYYDKDKKHIKLSMSEYSKEGKTIPHGPSTAYYKNGEKKVIINYQHGIREGNQTSWRDDGSLEKSYTWHKGKRTKIETYFKNGKIKQREVITPTNGSTMTYWHENGIKKHEFSIVKGLKDGIQKIWTEKGILESESVWKENKRNGQMKVYYGSGELKTSLQWKNNKMEGERITYNKKGKETAKSLYKNNEPLKGTVYDSDNFEIRSYENGKLVSKALCDNQGNLKK